MSGFTPGSGLIGGLLIGLAAALLLAGTGRLAGISNIALSAVDDIGRLLAASELDVTMLGTIAWDPKAAARGAASSSRAVQRSLFSRSLVDLVPRVRALAAPSTVAQEI